MDFGLILSHYSLIITEGFVHLGQLVYKALVVSSDLVFHGAHVIDYGVDVETHLFEYFLILFELECVFLKSFEADADISFKFVFLILTVDINGSNALVDVLKDVEIFSTVEDHLVELVQFLLLVIQIPGLLIDEVLVVEELVVQRLSHLEDQLPHFG